MATRKPTKQTDELDALTQARALVDLPEHGVKAGHLLEADPGIVADLAATGRVDAHADAVAYAKAAT